MTRKLLATLAIVAAAATTLAQAPALPGPFARSDANPILAPQGDGWEGLAVFNPGVLYEGGKYLMLYRAQDAKGVSRIGLATSSDGLRFTREAQPVFAPQGAGEAGGVEDPRVTKIGDTFYLTYTAWDGKGVAQTNLATSRDLHDWKRLGPIIRTPWNKAGAIYGRQVSGLWFMYYGDKSVQLATSKDLATWTPEPGVVLAPRPGKWDEGGVEPGPPPILTPRGILLIYNGRDRNNVYAVGAALFNPSDPGQLIARSDEPILRVETEYERTGTVPNVVFAEGLVVQDGLWRLYYGAGDKVIGLASWKQP